MLYEIKKSWPYILGGFLLLLYLSLGGYLFMTSGNKKAPVKGKIELTLAVPAGLKTAPIYRDKIRQFEKEHPDIKVNLMEISGGFYQKVLVMIAGGVAPDLMWMGQSFSEFADRGVFMDITDRLTASDIDLRDYESKILNLYKIDDHYYSLPFGVDVSFMIYNRKLFREAGLPYPDDNWDYDTFLKDAVKLTRKTESGKIITYGCKGGLPIEVFGASIFDSETGKVTCNTPEMINYFKTNLELAHKYKITPTPEENAALSKDTLENFKQEHSAIMLSHTMRWNRAFDLLKDMDWAMTLTPKVKRNGQWASSQAICIYRDTKQPDAAWKLFKSFQNKDFQLAMSCRTIPARKSIAKVLFRETENKPVNFKVLEKVVNVLYPTPRVPHLQELMAVFGRFSGMIFNRQISAEDGMAQCEAEMNRRIAKFKENEQKNKK